MELIKKDEPKLIFSNYIGEAYEKDGSVACEFRTTQHFAPIIVFPNGDMVVMSWEDIFNIAKKYKNEEVKNEV